MARVGRMVKESMVQEVASCFAERPNFFVTTFTRLSASEADSLRQQLHVSQGHLVVIKRRLGLLATQALKIQGLAELLEGSVGFVLAGGDILHTAKLLVEFRKTHENQLVLRGAVIDGRLLDLARVEELAHLPPKPVLLAQVVATIESPITDLIWTIEQLIGDLAWLVEQAAATKPATEAGTPPAGGVAEGSPDAAGGGKASTPKPEEGTPA